MPDDQVDRQDQGSQGINAQIGRSDRGNHRMPVAHLGILDRKKKPPIARCSGYLVERVNETIECLLLR
jgi:hypothetical protein